MNTSHKSPTFRYSKNLKGRPIMIHNLKSAINLEKSSIQSVKEPRKSHWINHFKNERDRNYPGLIQKIKNKRKSNATLAKLQTINPTTRQMITQKTKNGLSLHQLVLSKKKKKKLPPISETIPKVNINSFNKLGLSKDVFYLPEREKKTRHVTKKKIRKKKKLNLLPQLHSGKTTTLFENHKNIQDSWNKFHKKTKENKGYSRNLDRFISKYSIF